MSTAESAAQAAAQATTETQDTTSLLDDVLQSMPKYIQKDENKRDEVKSLVATFAAEFLKGTPKIDTSLSNKLDDMVAEIDEVLSRQLAEVMHHEKFQKLEGSWRGLHYLVDKTETSEWLRIKLLQVGKRELQLDLQRALEFDQSQLFKKVYTEEYDMPGGKPFGALIGDYEFSNHPQDVDMLSRISQVAAAGFCPFIASPAPQMFGLDSYQDLMKPRDLTETFLRPDWVKWNMFRESEDSRWVVLAMPRVMSRLPYGAATNPIDEFSYEELDVNERGEQTTANHSHYTWMSAAYALGTRLTDAFAKWGWCTAIRGYQNGGVIDNLPVHVYTNDAGERKIKCPTEINISERRDAELSKLGFMAIGHYKDTDYGCFFTGQTTQRPKKYVNNPDADANAEISARLPYMMAAGRIAHYLKITGRDWIGRFADKRFLENELQRWVNQFVSDREDTPEDLKKERPLQKAEIRVEEIPGKPGEYNAVAYLQPWLQLEKLNASLRMVAKIPNLNK